MRNARLVTRLTGIVAVLGLASAWWALRPSWQAPVPTLANRAEERMQDFRDALYFPIREWVSGGNPYDPAAMFAQHNASPQKSTSPGPR